MKNGKIVRYIRLYGAGFIMGAADIVPGVSGGTMAFILGIYNELLESIRKFCSPEGLKLILTFKVRKAFAVLPWPFLLTLGLGILSAIALLSSSLKWMLENRLSYILGFFFGLVAASIFSVCKRMEKWDPAAFAGLIAGTAAGWLVVGLSAVQSPPEGWWYLLICGAVAICAMILPGISGSFILLLMGKYKYVLDAVHQLKSGNDLAASLLTLVIFAVGVVLGLASFVRLLSWLLKRFHNVTIAVLIGFMAGSLRKVWPWKLNADINNGNVMPEAWDSGVLTALLLAILGLILVLVIDWVATRLESGESQKEA